MRRHWIDNLRWVTVLLVLLYHVIYYYNNKGVLGGYGGWGDGPQYQDAVLYILYPWFMMLLFLVAGMLFGSDGLGIATEHERVVSQPYAQTPCALDHRIVLLWLCHGILQHVGGSCSRS